jgi:hypothetical protein
VYGSEHVEDSENCCQRVEVSEALAEVGIDTTLRTTDRANRSRIVFVDLVGTA